MDTSAPPDSIQDSSAASLQLRRRDDEKYSPRTAGMWSRIAACLGLVYCAAFLFVLIPYNEFDPTSNTFLVTIALIGIWRYSWLALLAIRGWFYTRVRFPAWRQAADAFADAKVDRIYALVTSYRIEPEVTRSVYASLLRELAAYGQPAVVVAAVTARSDVQLLHRIVEEVNPPHDIEVVAMFQEGTGKRSAMAEALRAISRRMPTRNSACILMDGDCRLTTGVLEKTLPFLRMMPDVGAITVNNRGITTGGPWTRDWYDLRFAQRHVIMSALSLSRRLLVLTGRFSVFRARLAVDPSFIEQLENDEIDHWRFGRFKFLSGDDKSTWFWLLKHNWRMLYVPDARVDSFEQLPTSTLLSGATALFKRWFGNMLRANGRAIALGPRRVGGFLWWALVDQRISMWTSLVGPVAAIMLAINYRWSFILVYLLWVLLTRTVMTIGLWIVTRRASPFWPFLLFFNQILGAMMKIYVSFRLNRQTWTRQHISTGAVGSRLRNVMQTTGNVVLHTTAMVCFLVSMLFYTGLLQLPKLARVSSAASAVMGPSLSVDVGSATQVTLSVPPNPASLDENRAAEVEIPEPKPDLTLAQQ